MASFSSPSVFSPSLKKPSKPFAIQSSPSSSPPSSNLSTNFDLKSYWSTLLTQLNTHLSTAIPIRFPEKIHHSMRHSVLSPHAKRAAPILCISTACDLFSLPLSAAFPTAAALEFVHSASLIHDDLPSFDSAPSRRGLPSNHSIFGVDFAILAGDALFPLAFEHIVGNTDLNVVDPETVVGIVKEISRAVGCSGMAAGQFLDLDFENCGNVMEIVEKKFGEMAECSAVCGGLLGGAREEEIRRLRTYGRAVGVLYHLVDEILMVGEGPNGNYGGKMRSNASVVKAVGMEKAMEMVEELSGKAKRELQWFEEAYGKRKVMPLYSFVDYAVERSFVFDDVVVNATA